MLKRLSIRNIAIIDALDLDFEDGLTVITGESGSGKSILLDAVALAFGARVSPKEALRAGCARGQVELLFELGHWREHADFRAFLLGQGVDVPPEDTEILLSRELTSGGSRSRINGTPVGRETLEALRARMIDLHGQHELTSLFRAERQRACLDGYGRNATGKRDILQNTADERESPSKGLPRNEAAGETLASLKRTVAVAYDEWKTLKQRHDVLIASRSERLRQRDFLVFQLNELQEADLRDVDEDIEARRELDLLSHAEKRLRVAARSAMLLSEGGSVEESSSALLDQLSQLEKHLAEGTNYDPGLDALLTQVQGAHAELKAVAGELVRYADRVEMSPERLAALTDRLDVLEKLKRKYGPALRDVLATRDRLAEELDALEHAEQDAETLDAAVAEAEVRLANASRRLGDVRRAVAEDLKAALLVQLRSLSMSGVSFDVAFTPTAYGPDGMEEVTFLFSANPGEPLRPLAKVASGGELSRFLLAMKVLTAENDGLLTLVFDEIDSGVSGPTAKALAEKLATLSRRLQVLAITHQPVIAAMGRRHLHVEKHVQRSEAGEESVRVAVQSLDPGGEERLSVLSRLASGMETSDKAVEKFIRRLRADADAFYRELSPLVSTAE
jgi:DNA repair protein RecN (Recombination protein N)